MDFPTRNLYRSAIEELARGSELSELDIAERALATCRAACEMADGDSGADAGAGRVAIRASI